MFIKIVLQVIAFVYLGDCFAGKIQSSAVAKATYIFQDSIPAINTLADESIDTVRERRKTGTLDVKMKNGAVYSYNSDKIKKEWENKKGLPRKIEAVIEEWDKTFTKVEHPASFPGGDEAWNDYIKKFIEENKTSLKHKGSGKIYVQFIVDTDGELSSVEALQGADPALAAIAVDAVTKGPFWVPAMQNGRKVVAYQKAVVKF